MTNETLEEKIKRVGRELGFQQTAITQPTLDPIYRERLITWLARGYHGEMAYFTRHGLNRTDARKLVAETTSVIMVRLDYLPPNPAIAQTLSQPMQAFISRYALGRDYHKLIRKRLKTLAEQIKQTHPSLHYRPFADSAPIMEKPFAEQAGLGWIGKHTNLINPKAGSWFFLGSLLTNLNLTPDPPFQKNHCGSCNACITVCPTNAIVAPYVLDARRCISYLTIELKTAIPLSLRSLIGNRIYGCDDCQLVCPWNKFARTTTEKAFHPRHKLETADLISLFSWEEETFLRYTEGSAIRRIGHACWLRNLAVALGNTPKHDHVIAALKRRLEHPSELVREHVLWALEQQTLK